MTAPILKVEIMYFVVPIKHVAKSFAKTITVIKYKIIPTHNTYYRIHEDNRITDYLVILFLLRPIFGNLTFYLI